MRNKLVVTLTLISIAVLLFAAQRVHDVLSAGNGFVAKNICSGHFISGMPAHLVMDQALKPASSTLAKTQFHIDPVKKTVDTNFYGIAQRRAVFSKGIGCTLLTAGESTFNHQFKPVAMKPLDSNIAWPHGSAPVQITSSLSQVLEKAFDEPDPVLRRNSKAVVVIHKGQLIAEKYADGITPSTPLIGWSMTKSVTNLLLGLLVHDGALALDQPAPVPLWQRNKEDPRADITISQLLRMSSGLEFDESYGPYTDVTRMLSVAPSAAEYAASKPLAHTPDTRWSYSSGTSNILAGVIKNVVGNTFQDYYEFPQNRLFLPLGIHTASMETDNSGTGIGSSYMYASARDWARLGQFCLQDGVWQGVRLIPENWIKFSTTPTPTNPARNFGAHFWLNEKPVDPALPNLWPRLPTDTYSMNGYQGQRVIIVPSRELVVVRMGFSPHGDRGIEELVADLIMLLEERPIIPGP